ncbi:WYL domain-containing protein [Streptococcus mutans]|nr:WYL domain-containing protein [Streptococcus mutans]
MAESKTKRLLYFMSELEKGNQINKEEYIAKFNISDRTMKEDVSELKTNLKELRPNMQIKFSRKHACYFASYEQGYGNLKYNQAVILSKILLESRALRKEEVAEIINIFVERAVDDKERTRIKKLTQFELNSYQELKFYQKSNKSILPTISAIFDAIVDQRPLAFSYAKPSSKVEEYIVLPISVIFDNHYFYCISYKLDNCFQSRYELQELRYFRVDRFKTIHKSISNSAFALTEEEQERLITDEQVRYQTFSMLSDQKWVRIQFRYTGQFRDVLEADIPKLKMINELEEGIIYEIETLSLLGFQKYIQRFDGDFVFLNIKSIKK